MVFLCGVEQRLYLQKVFYLSSYSLVVSNMAHCDVIKVCNLWNTYSQQQTRLLIQLRWLIMGSL